MVWMRLLASCVGGPRAGLRARDSEELLGTLAAKWLWMCSSDSVSAGHLAC